jgi:hypothetical protein
MDTDGGNNNLINCVSGESNSILVVRHGSCTAKLETLGSAPTNAGPWIWWWYCIEFCKTKITFEFTSLICDAVFLVKAWTSFFFQVFQHMHGSCLTHKNVPLLSISCQLACYAERTNFSLNGSPDWNTKMILEVDILHDQSDVRSHLFLHHVVEIEYTHQWTNVHEKYTTQDKL